ncbi:MAG: S41 family peptidase [Planctomycetales bacterium]
MRVELSARRVLCSLLVILAACCSFRTSIAEPSGKLEASADAVQALSQGVDFERSLKWPQAIEHYEKALKQYQTTDLEYGLRRSKIHFSIERRYSDLSFQRSLRTLSLDEATQTFNEVLSKIQNNYVDPMSSTSFVAHGTESFYLALADQKFIDHNLPNTPSSEIQPFRKLLREKYWNKPIADRQAAVNTVREVAGLAEEQLKLSPGATVMEYVFGGCNALDDYSCFLTSGRLKDLHNNIQGQFIGLGIEMKAEAGKGMLLMHVLPNSPAEQGGLLAGEHIVKVAGKDCRNLNTDATAGLLQGREGSQVTLEIMGETGNLRTATFTRRPVEVKSVPIARMIDSENGIGYLQLTGFQSNTGAEFDAALAKLQSQGMRALVWDVRGNPGGLLDAAVEVLDRFIANGVMVSTRGRIVNQNHSFNAHQAGTLNMPLVLITDGDSASASEIVAGCIRDHHRGTIIGRKTYGKWSVQTILDLDTTSSGLRLTTAKFYSPNGHNLAKIGVTPDIELPEPKKERGFFRKATEVNLAEDTDLQKAVELLQKGKIALQQEKFSDSE